MRAVLHRLAGAMATVVKERLLGRCVCVCGTTCVKRHRLGTLADKEAAHVTKGTTLNAKPHVHAGSRQTVKSVKFCACLRVLVGWATEVPPMHVGEDCLQGLGHLAADGFDSRRSASAITMNLHQQKRKPPFAGLCISNLHLTTRPPRAPTAQAHVGPFTRPSGHPTFCDTNWRMSQVARARACGAPLQ